MRFFNTHIVNALTVTALMVGFTGVAGAGEIHVARAKWGSADVTAKAAAFCDTKNQCDYKVSEKFLGPMGTNAAKSFLLAYSCSTGKGAKILTASAAAGAAEGTVLKLDCPVTPLTAAEMKAMFGNRTSMFRQVLATPAKNAQMVVDLGDSCASAINAVTHSQKSLRSEALQAAIMPLDQERFASGVQDFTFFHHTNSAEFVELLGVSNTTPQAAFSNALRNQTFEKEFEYLHTLDVENTFRFWYRLLYVAEDPFSSASYGQYNIEFTLAPKARLLKFNTAIWQAALDEIGKRYPSIAGSCNMQLEDAGAEYGNSKKNDLFYIIAEDSGVEIIDYGQEHRWYQVVSPTGFRGLRLAP